jgi:hypothetical protein
MGERTPVTTVAELDTLDATEIIEGYLSGLDGDPEPGDNRSKAFWHGWRNGHMDLTGEPDEASRKLTQAMFDTGYFRRLPRDA